MLAAKYRHPLSESGASEFLARPKGGFAGLTLSDFSFCGNGRAVQRSIGTPWPAAAEGVSIRDLCKLSFCGISSFFISVYKAVKIGLTADAKQTDENGPLRKRDT